MRRGGAIKNTEPEEDKDGGERSSARGGACLQYHLPMVGAKLFPDRAPIEIETVGGVIDECQCEAKSEGKWLKYNGFDIYCEY